MREVGTGPTAYNTKLNELKKKKKKKKKKRKRRRRRK
jgi:hypothetical protein